MSPELITAIRDRIAAGQTKDEIKSAVLATGHAEVVFESAYTLALHDLEKLAVHTTAPAKLPSAYELLEDALSFIVKRLDTVLLVLIPSLIFFALTYAGEKVTEPQLLTSAIDAFSIVAFIVYMMAIFSAMYIVSEEDKVASYSEALLWSKRNLLAIFGISILMFLVIIGGFVLFIIPGIILSLTLYFSQYALIIENQKGAAALSRSRELVKGRFWAIAAKLAAFTFYIVAPIFVVMMVVVFAATTNPALAKFSLAGEIGLEVVSAFVTVLGTYAMSRLYRAMQVGRPLPEISATRTGVYWFLALLGLATMAALVALVVYFDPNLDETITKDASVLQSEVQNMTMSAMAYAVDHDGSFEGVCDTLRPQLVSADSVECNDNETQWAIMGMVGEERWCADTTSTGKQAKSALGERLTCLSLPATQPLETPTEEATSSEVETGA